jgi:hypothetical protein
MWQMDTVGVNAGALETVLADLLAGKLADKRADKPADNTTVVQAQAVRADG